jgi:ADP-heptose:LPS heptosyltransferase
VKPLIRKTQRLQWIDRYIGVPLCFLLSIGRSIVRLFGGEQTENTKNAVSKIILLKLAEQGSTVLAHDAILRAVARVGRENVHFFAFEENRFIVDLLDLIPSENVLTLRTNSAWALATSCAHRLRQIRRLRIDTCVDMEFFTRFTAMIAYLTGATHRVGFHTSFGEGPYRGDLMTHRVLYNPHLHASQTFSSLILALDVAPTQWPTFDRVAPGLPILPTFASSPAQRESVLKLFDSVGLPRGARLILLNANASDLLPLRKWDGGNYVALAQKLLRAFPELYVAFTGSPDEVAAIESLCASVGDPGRSFCLAGKTTMRELLTLFELAEILVTNDSGPAHFASLTSIDVVVLFGPETPALYAPLGPHSHPLWAGIACSPCVSALNNRQTKCRDNVCMQRLSVEHVLDKVSSLYRQKSGLNAAGPSLPAARGRHLTY